MNKTLIALAVAGVVAAPMAAQAEIGGYAQIGYWDKTVDGPSLGGIIGITMSGEATTDGGSTVYGFVSLTASGQDIGVGSPLATTGSVVGIKGDFGNISFGDGGSGAHLAQFAGDAHDVTVSARYRHSFGYTNTFGDIKFRVTQDISDDWDKSLGSPGDQEGATTVGVQGTFGGVTVGFGQEDEDTVVGAKMSFGDISLAIHSTDWDNGDDSTPAIKVSWSSGRTSLSYFTEDRTIGGVDNTRTQIDGSYSLGGGASVKLRVRTDDLNDGREYTRLMLAISF